MKLFKRCHAALCLSLLLAFCFSLTAFAASLVDAGISRRELDALRAMLEEDRL